MTPKQHSVLREFANNWTLGGMKVIPVYRKMGTLAAGADAFTRARDIEEVLDALPGLLEQLEATEQERLEARQETLRTLVTLDEAIEKRKAVEDQLEAYYNQESKP